MFRKLLSRHSSKKSTNKGIESIVGEKCVATEKINNFQGCGQVQVKGQLWAARACSDDDVFEMGETLRIVAIEGVKLICKKL